MKVPSWAHRSSNLYAHMYGHSHLFIFCARPDVRPDVFTLLLQPFISGCVAMGTRIQTDLWDESVFHPGHKIKPSELLPPWSAKPRFIYSLKVSQRADVAGYVEVVAISDNHQLCDGTYRFGVHSVCHPCYPVLTTSYQPKGTQLENIQTSSYNLNLVQLGNTLNQHLLGYLSNIEEATEVFMPLQARTGSKLRHLLSQVLSFLAHEN